MAVRYDLDVFPSALCLLPSAFVGHVLACQMRKRCMSVVIATNLL
jgi:hypothetical protein